ncbi:hypothetical protein GGD83_003106 [Rhodoblastus sphagnicola]|nr:hypothetical protein [Rhodoblastus sphagnicola]
MSSLNASIARHLNSYDSLRPHSSLDRRTPDEAHLTPVPIALAA